LHKAVEAARGDFNTVQESLLLKFWPSNPSDHTFEKEFLNAFAAVVGFVTVLAGGPAAAALGPVVAGITGGVILGLKTTNTQLKDAATMGL